MRKVELPSEIKHQISFIYKNDKKDYQKVIEYIDAQIEISDSDENYELSYVLLEHKNLFIEQRRKKFNHL
jgi:hypothetical protein